MHDGICRTKSKLISLLDLSFATFKELWYVEDSLSQRCLIKMHLFDIFVDNFYSTHFSIKYKFILNTVLKAFARSNIYN